MSRPRSDAEPVKNVLLTGAASGIGRHLAGAFARRGDRVLATDANSGALGEARRDDGWDELRIVDARLDVTVAQDWEDVLRRFDRDFGPLDILMNVAGALRPANVVDIEDRDIALHLDVNVRGIILGTRAAARRMVPLEAGHIVNFGSLASLAPVPGLSLYTASKFAVRGFTLSAAVELREHGVSVSLVMPDAVATPMLDLQLDYKEAALTFSGSKPLTVQDIEKLVFEVVLPKKPVEIAIPMGRGLLARAASAAPQMGQALYPLLKKKGLKSQAKAKKTSQT